MGRPCAPRTARRVVAPHGQLPRPPWYFRGMAPTAARRAKLVQRTCSQGLQSNCDACHPRRGVVGPSYGSFASGQARKLIPSAGPPLPTEPASLGFGGGPNYCKRQWGGRQGRPGSCQPITAHRRHGPPFWGGQGGEAPRPFFPPISSGRNGGPGRVGPPPRGHPRQVDGAPRSSRPTSSTQVTDRSLRRKRQSSFPPLCLLSPPNPLRWASAGAPLLS